VWKNTVLANNPEARSKTQREKHNHRSMWGGEEEARGKVNICLRWVNLREGGGGCIAVVKKGGYFPQRAQQGKKNLMGGSRGSQPE